MKLNLKAALAGVVTAGIAGGGLFALAAPASAAPSAPPWEADGNAAPPYGNLTFYDPAGNQVTSGTGDLASPFAYVVAGTAADSGATKATVSFYNPGSNGSSLPANWTGTQEGNTTSFSPPPTGTPADLVAFANNSKGTVYPVAPTTANITQWLSTNNANAAPYANIIQVRLADSGPSGGNAPGTYWETDIGYNTTGSAMLVDGTNVPANGWAQLFPFVTATTTSLITSATGGHLISGNPITLTATVPTGDAGAVQFYDNGTFLADSAVNTATGQATYSYTPAVGSHPYTASFIPGDSPGDETGANSTSATIIGGSTSSAVTVSDTPPQTATTTTLSANSTSVSSGTPVTFTSTVSAADSTNPAGTVEFVYNSSAISGCSSVAVNPPASATCTTSSLPAGDDSVTAVFTPTSNSYATSTSSPPVVVTVTPPANTCTYGANDSAPLTTPCADQQNVTVTINPGTITITTPYSSSNPFTLPAMTLSSDGSYFQTSATFPATTLPNSQQIVVTSTLAPAYAWTLSVSATPIGPIPASGLGLTNGAVLNSSGSGAYPGVVTFHNIAALNPSPADSAGTGPGLSSAPQQWATSTAADGSAEMNGTLTLLAATSTPAGTYTGTITFSVS